MRVKVVKKITKIKISEDELALGADLQLNQRNQ